MKIGRVNRAMQDAAKFAKRVRARLVQTQPNGCSQNAAQTVRPNT